MKIAIVALLFVVVSSAVAARNPNDPYNFFFGIPFVSVGYRQQGRTQSGPPQAGVPQSNGQPQVGGQWGGASVNARSKRQAGWNLPGPLSGAQQQAQRAGQAGHGQLIDFGENTGKNLGYAGKAVGDGWWDFHTMFDGHMNNGHNGLKLFGQSVGGLLGRFSPGLAGLWNGFQAQVDKDIDTQKQRLEGFGERVHENIQHGNRQVGGVWQGVRDNVDQPLRQGLGTPVLPAPRPVRPQANANAGAGANGGLGFDVNLKI